MAGRPRSMENMFKSDIPQGKTKQGDAGFDNIRDNIDPHIVSKVIDVNEIKQKGVQYNLATINAAIANHPHQDVNTTASPTFVKIKTAAIYPSADAVTAVQIRKADATTNVLNVDTTNARIGVGTDTPVTDAEIYKSTAHPVLTITGAHATDYDPQIQFKTDASPTVKWSMGVDATADIFRLCKATSVGANDNDLTIDTSHQFGIGSNPNANTKLVVAGGATETLRVYGQFSNANSSGILCYAYQMSGNAGAFSGISSQPTFFGTDANLSTMYGFVQAPGIAGTATKNVTTMVGCLTKLNNASTGGSVITNGYNFLIQEATGTGTITNLYGIYINSLARGSTLNYAIYTNTGLVRFGDNVSSTGYFTSGAACSFTTGTTIGNLTLADGSITDSSGAISFNNENLSTTGTIQPGGYKSSDGSAGVSGSFTTVDLKTVTVKDGIITSIV